MDFCSLLFLLGLQLVSKTVGHSYLGFLYYGFVDESMVWYGNVLFDIIE